MNRRKFVRDTAYSTTGVMLASLNTFATPVNAATHANFKLLVLATNWGFEGSMDAYCAKVAKERYNGIEIWWPTTKAAQDELFAALKKYGLQVGFLVAGHESDPVNHLTSFKKMLDAAANNTVQRPLYINCHSGKDFFGFDENQKLVDYTIAVAAKTGLKVLHETHRSRMLFAAPVAKKFIEANKDLRLTLDISHWCNVHETYLNDQQETVNMALQRTDHIHARIGHPEGPQVNDPRAPEWEPAINAHFAWWDKVVEMKRQKGETITFLTEFGPPDYMPTEPYTRKPLADQWAVNVHMLKVLRERYS